MSEQFAQFQPGSLIRGQESHAGLFCVVTYEHRYEQGQDEDSSEEVEDYEENCVSLRDVGLRLKAATSRRHCCPHDVGPSLLRYDLEENAKRAPKIVEAKVLIGCLSRCENIPSKRCIGKLAYTVDEIGNAGVIA